MSGSPLSALRRGGQGVRRRMAGRVDPRLGAVHPHLFLPDGNATLDLFDHEAAGLERFRTVPRNTHVPPRSGADTSARSASRAMGFRTRYLILPPLFTP